MMDFLQAINIHSQRIKYETLRRETFPYTGILSRWHLFEISLQT